MKTSNVHHNHPPHHPKHPHNSHRHQIHHLCYRPLNHRQHLRSFLLGILLLQLTSCVVVPHAEAASKSSKSSHPSEIESDISWPQAFDEFDQKLINIVRSKRQADLEEEDERPGAATTTSTTPAPATNTTKNFTIDWDEVERNWVKVLSEEEVAQKWNAMETKLKNGVRSLLRTIFPQIVSMSSDAKVSGNCSAGILKWIISLRHLKGWAIKMLDAIGKPPSGLLEGALTMFGNHQECLKIRAPDDEDDFEDEEEGVKPKFKEFFRGKYCLLELKPWLPKKPHFYGFVEKVKSLEREPDDDTVFGELTQYAIFLHFVAFRVELCVPSICQREDIQRVANFLAKVVDFRARVTRCEVESDSFVEVGVIQILTILSFFGFLGLVISASVIYYLYPLVRKGKRPPALVKYMSLTRGWQEMCGLDFYQKKPKLAVLYGLRYIVMMWIILVHTIAVINYQFIREMMTLKDVALKQALQIMTNSSLQYSTLIFISAFCFGYYNDGKGAGKGIVFVIKKYFRLIPIVMTGMAFIILMPLLDTGLLKGPVWGDFVTNRTEVCQTKWWRNLFFIQNFFHPEDTCLPETWVLCVEMQLAFVFSFVLGIMHSFKKSSHMMSWLVLVGMVFVGLVANILEVYFYDLPPTWLWTLPDPEQRNEYFYLHLYKPWTHLSVYAIGVGCGIFCADRKKGFSGGPYGKTVTSMIGWSSCGIVAGAIIFYPHNWVLGKLPDELFSGIYDGIHRIVWAGIHCVIFFLLSSGMDEEDKSKSFAYWILGNKCFIAFGRLTLTAFVMHPIIQLFFFATQQTHIFSGLILWVYFIVGNILFTYALAFFVTMFVEMPTSAIFRTRDSTRHKQDVMDPDSFPKFNKPATFAVGSNRNGDIEMSKSSKTGIDNHAVRL